MAYPVVNSPMFPSVADAGFLPPKLRDMPIFNPGVRRYRCPDGQVRMLTENQAINGNCVLDESSYMMGGTPMLGQINAGFSWNTAPGGWNPYVPAIRPQIPNTFGGPSAQEPAAPAGSCFTCTNPSTGDTKYGVPSAMASTLKGQGYRCRADDCAGQPAASPVSFPGAISYGGPAATYQGVNGDFGGDQGGYMMMGRIPVQRGIGRRALGGW